MANEQSDANSYFSQDVYDGYMITTIKHDGHERLYKGTPFVNWGYLKLDFSGTVAESVKHKSGEGEYYSPSFSGPARVLSSTVRRYLREPNCEFVEALARIKYIPNGQLKNFLVCCRTFWNVGQVCRIAVVGSKSQSGSGVWHKYLALYLARTRASVSIDFIDPNEVDKTWSHNTGSCEIECRWIPTTVNSEELSAYDAVSSDVWNYGTKTDWGVPPVPCYSLKGGMDQYEPFLHYAETRLFSEPPSAYSSHCPCLVCKACAQSASGWESFSLLRMMCARLGCPSRCSGVSWVYDLNTIHDMRQKLLAGGLIPVVSENFRYIMALSSEEAIDQGHMHFSLGNVVRKLDPRIKHTGLIDKKFQPELEGKVVAFVGVSPSIMGGTRYNPAQLTFGSDVEVMFVSSVSAWQTSFLADNVYCPERPDVVKQRLFGWTWTGGMIGEYYHYVPMREIPSPVRVKSLSHGKVMSLKVYRHGTSLVEYDGTLPVYANGLSYTKLTPSSPDLRSYFSTTFYKLEDVDKGYQLVAHHNPLFSVDDVKKWQEDGIPNVQLYRQKHRIKCACLGRVIDSEVSSVIEFFRNTGYRLCTERGPLPLLFPVFSTATYHAGT